MRKQTPKQTTERNDRRINHLYGQRCSGIQINIMDITKVFKAGQAAIAANPAINDDELGDAILKFVQTIRQN
jgi:hypothetical protein